MSNSEPPDFSEPERSLQWHYETACYLHNHIEGQVTLAVMKSTVLLAAHTVLGAAYIPVAGTFKVFERRIETFADALFIFSGVLLLFAFIFSLMSLWPKRKSGYENRLTFYAGIANISSAQEYEEKYWAVSKKALCSMLIADVYGKSVWLRRMFNLVRTAITFSAIGTISCVFSMSLLKGHSFLLLSAFLYAG